jgi:hypothetical protein
MPFARRSGFIPARSRKVMRHSLGLQSSGLGLFFTNWVLLLGRYSSQFPMATGNSNDFVMTDNAAPRKSLAEAHSIVEAKS